MDHLHSHQKQQLHSCNQIYHYQDINRRLPNMSYHVSMEVVAVMHLRREHTQHCGLVENSYHLACSVLVWWVPVYLLVSSSQMVQREQTGQCKAHIQTKMTYHQSSYFRLLSVFEKVIRGLHELHVSQLSIIFLYLRLLPDLPSQECTRQLSF